MAVHLHGAGLVHANAHRALAPLTLDVADGEAVALIGPSGAGKTSLLNLIGAVLRPSEGEIDVLGVRPWAIAPAALRRLRARIGLAHQAPPIPPRQRVVTAVLAGRLGQWSSWRGLRSLIYPVDAAGASAQLARFDLDERLYERCDHLSGGQLQRVGLARLLYQQADLMLADEPVSAMDPALADRAVQVLVDEARARGVTLIASLHAVDLARRHFPRIVGIERDERDGGGGRIAFDRPASEVTDAMLDALYRGEEAEASAAGEAAPWARPSPVLQPCR
jgi:phosphonate transport system ATP-binding protein